MKLIVRVVLGLLLLICFIGLLRKWEGYLGPFIVALLIAGITIEVMWNMAL